MDRNESRLSDNDNDNLLSLGWEALGRLVRDRAMAEAFAGLHEGTGGSFIGDGDELDPHDRAGAKRRS